MTMSVEAFGQRGRSLPVACRGLRCELVASDGSSRVRGTVKRRNDNRYNISYQPQATGEHQLHILIKEHPILNSAFTVAAQRRLDTIRGIITFLSTVKEKCMGKKRFFLEQWRI